MLSLPTVWIEKSALRTDPIVKIKHNVVPDEEKLAKPDMDGVNKITYRNFLQNPKEEKPGQGIRQDCEYMLLY